MGISGMIIDEILCLFLFMLWKFICIAYIAFPFSFSPLIRLRFISAWWSHTTNWGHRQSAMPSLVSSITIISSIWAYLTRGRSSRTYWIGWWDWGNKPKRIRGCKNRRRLCTWGTCGCISRQGYSPGILKYGLACENQLVVLRLQGRWCGGGYQQWDMFKDGEYRTLILDTPPPSPYKEVKPLLQKKPGRS